MFPTPSTHFLDFFVGAIVSAIIYGVISFGLFYLFDRGTKFFVNRLFSQILKRGKSSGK